MITYLKPESYIIAFDPGRTTGLVIAYYYGGRNFEITRAEEIRWHNRMQITRDVLWYYMPKLCLIIIEDFKLFEDKAEDQAGDDMPSSQMIGIIECRAFDLGLNEITIKQMPGVKNRVQVLDRHYRSLLIENEETKRMIVSEHTFDAYKHIRHRIVKELSAKVR